MDQHQISSSPRDIPGVKMPKIAFAVLQFQGGQCCTGRPELRDSPFCQKSGSISFRHNIKVTTGRSINIQCPIFAEVVAIFLTPPITIYLRIKARQPAVSFSASLPKLLE